MLVMLLHFNCLNLLILSSLWFALTHVSSTSLYSISSSFQSISAPRWVPRCLEAFARHRLQRSAAYDCCDVYVDNNVTTIRSLNLFAATSPSRGSNE
jgi:hypothetical protein